MLAENLPQKDNYELELKETLDSYILKENNYTISYKARFIGFKHRSKVEFLRFFIV